jgi:hypothetical protein
MDTPFFQVLEDYKMYMTHHFPTPQDFLDAQSVPHEAMDCVDYIFDFILDIMFVPVQGEDFAEETKENFVEVVEPHGRKRIDKFDIERYYLFPHQQKLKRLKNPKMKREGYSCLLAERKKERLIRNKNKEWSPLRLADGTLKSSFDYPQEYYDAKKKEEEEEEEAERRHKLAFTKWDVEQYYMTDEEYETRKAINSKKVSLKEICAMKEAGSRKMCEPEVPGKRFPLTFIPGDFDFEKKGELDENLETEEDILEYQKMMKEFDEDNEDLLFTFEQFNEAEIAFYAAEEERKENEKKQKEIMLRSLIPETVPDFFTNEEMMNDKL